MIFSFIWQTDSSVSFSISPPDIPLQYQMTSSLLSNIISDDDNENKTDISVAKIVCSVIEFLFTNTKKYKINKLEIALTVYEQLFGNLTEEQKKTIIKNIEHIVEHKLIQKISKLELAKNDIAGFLKFILF